MLTSKIIKNIKNFIPEKNILTSIEECYAYSMDALNNPYLDLKIPEGVVFVETIEQVQKIVKLANKTRTPIICRGAGTNTVGACTTPNGGIILNFSKMNKILEINKENMTAKVQSGVIVGDLQKAVEDIGLFYPPDPSNLKVSTIGGSIAQNSAGARCFKYGATKDYVISLTVVTADGEILETGANTIKNATGYNLGSIFIGSEGTLGIIVEATLKLIPKPEDIQVITGYFDSVESAISAVNLIIDKQIYPSTIDFMDKNAMITVEQFHRGNFLTDKEAVLLIDVDGDKDFVKKQITTIQDILAMSNATHINFSQNQREYDKIWNARRLSMASCGRLKPNVTTDDLIVPRQNLARLVKGVNDICKEYNLLICMVGHVGDGSVHPQIPIDLSDKLEYERYKKAKAKIYDLTVKLNGLISGEHGIGIEKKEYIGNVINYKALDYMRQIKKLFDPKNILNPYKIF